MFYPDFTQQPRHISMFYLDFTQQPRHINMFYPDPAARASCTSRHQAKLQTFSDQLKFVYRDYANAVNAWKVEKQTMERRVSVKMAVLPDCQMC
jgi:hypothetical protein